MTNSVHPGKTPANGKLSGITEFITSVYPRDTTRQALLLLGITTLTFVFGLSREVFNIFGGNEYLLGSVLFSWHLLFAAGIWIGGMPFTRFIKKDPMAIAFMILCLIPVVSLLILEYGSVIFWDDYQQAGFWELTGFSMLVLAPVALLTGVLFSHLSQSLSENNNRNMLLPAINWLGIGALAGALLFIILHFTILDNIQQILIVGFFNLAFGWTLAFRGKNILLNTVAFFINITLLSLLIAFELREDFFRLQRPDATEIRDQQESGYGQLSASGADTAIRFFSGNASYDEAGNEVSIEESVHYTMLQHFNPQSVLLINGTNPAYADEIMKYKPRRLDILESDPAIIPWLEQYKQARKGNGINYIRQDPINYLSNNDIRYDVVMLMLPDPTNLQINRYYTLEFFKTLKKSLSDTAFVYAGLSKGSSRSQEMNSIVFYTMKKVFRYTILIPGANSHFLASGNILSIKLGAKAEKKGITLNHINTNPADTSVRDRVESAMKNLTVEIKLNRDYHPSAFFTLVAATMPSMDGISIAVSLVLMLLTAFYLFKGKSKRISVFLTGFTLLSVMVILLMSYQAMFGNLYFMMGLLLGMIPAGIALGILLYKYKEKQENAPSVAALQVAIGSFSVVVLFFLLGIKEITDCQPLITSLYLLFSLTGGAIAGMQLNAVIDKYKDDGDKLPGSLHLALLLGMALGALVGIALILPVVGLILGCIILGVVNASLGFLFY